jgi:peroxiredoxin
MYAFHPPANAIRVQDLFHDLDEEAVIRSRLLGNRAPEISLPEVGGGEFRLSDERDEHLVVVGFWSIALDRSANELERFAELADMYRDKDVTFLAIDMGPDAEAIREILKGKPRALRVALDGEGELAETYGVSSFPSLVVIDKRGTVQSLHVECDANARRSIRHEIAALFAGRNVAAETLRLAEHEQALRNVGLKPLWSRQGEYKSATLDPAAQQIYAIRQGVAGPLAEVFDLEGKLTREFDSWGIGYNFARPARWTGGEHGFVAFTPSGNTVLATKPDGTRLWQTDDPSEIDDVWTADLDGDGADEVILGYSRGTGLQVISPTGQTLWSRDDLKNVRHVCAGDIDGDGKPEVVAPSEDGGVAVFDGGNGKLIRTLKAGSFAYMIRVAPARTIPKSRGDVILVIGEADAGVTMTALSGDGKTHWTVPFPGRSDFAHAFEVAPGGRLAAIAFHNGVVNVVDLQRGQIVARTSHQGEDPTVGWTIQTDAATPVLLVCTHQALKAFRLKPIGSSAP